MSAGESGEPLDQAKFERFIEFLKDPRDSARVWSGLRFMEERGIDFRVRANELRAYVQDAEISPLDDPRGADHELVRQTILDIRDEVRAELGKAPLTEAERSAWDFEVSPPADWRPDQLVSKVWADTHHPSEAETADAIARLDESLPALMAAVRQFLEWNREQSLAGGELESIGWAQSTLTSKLKQLRPDLDASGNQNLKNDVITALRKANS